MEPFEDDKPEDDVKVEGFELRWEVYKQLRKWGLPLDGDKSVYVRTYELIRGGNKGLSNSYSDTSVTEDDVRMFEALLGPNGYTIYKMLLAKRDEHGP
jgi:hypothetical protein